MHILTKQEWQNEGKQIMHDDIFWFTAAFIVLAWWMGLSWFLQMVA